MSILDWIFTGFVILLAVRCFAKGFVQEVLSVASWAGGLFSALLFSNAFSEFAARTLGTGLLSPTVQYVISFMVCFILGFLIMKLIEKLIREGLEAAHLEVFNKILGLVLGLAEGLAIVALILIIMEIQPFFNADGILASSMYAKTILPLLGPTINNTIKPALDGSKPLKIAPPAVTPLLPSPGKK
ncbi:MAG: CvpA family protein [Spirochaetaceae bacterium]|nr:CvpA family protein [Spirochaetaceae bacterium]